MKANRGKNFEKLVEYQNELYRRQGIAVIQKVPTPMVKLSNGQSFYKEKSTVDFIGSYKGYAIAFDCKQTAVATRFDFSKISDHQIEFLVDWEGTGGFAFILIEFTAHKEIYLMPIHDIQIMQASGFKSIKYDDIKEICEKVTNKHNVCDYLSVVEKEWEVV